MTDRYAVATSFQLTGHAAQKGFALAQLITACVCAALCQYRLVCLCLPEQPDTGFPVEALQFSMPVKFPSCRLIGLNLESSVREHKCLYSVLKLHV